MGKAGCANRSKSWAGVFAPTGCEQAGWAVWPHTSGGRRQEHTQHFMCTKPLLCARYNSKGHKQGSKQYAFSCCRTHTLKEKDIQQVAQQTLLKKLSNWVVGFL